MDAQQPQKDDGKINVVVILNQRLSDPEEAPSPRRPIYSVSMLPLIMLLPLQ